ncbi:SIMPL domain-containing protein [Kordiimonas pumila]|uniref:SIMPL domain-containing protein n=1 Tax=Kordiimonas pumila TaxID=2161677 RepID=A0ABV7D7Y9_9PROT|nr:SIMPL domain-containing protein [Kordiimonas pumila]
MQTNPIQVFSAAFIALGIAASGWFISQGFIESRADERYVTVKGLAETQVRADRAVWAITFIAANDVLQEARNKLTNERDAVFKFLDTYSISKSDTEMQSLRVVDQLARTYNNGPVANRYLIQQTILVRSNDIDAVANAAQNVGDMLDAGVLIGNLDGYGESTPHYLFTKLNDIKPSMIAEATANARVAAQQFAHDAGTTINGIRKANQGNFQILPAEDAPGLIEANQIHKKVRVVTTLEYILGR